MLTAWAKNDSTIAADKETQGVMDSFGQVGDQYSSHHDPKKY